MPYAAVAFHPSLPNGKSSGWLALSCEGAAFEADPVPDVPEVHDLHDVHDVHAVHAVHASSTRVLLPIDGLQVTMGGAADRLIFFAHPAAPDWTVYTSDKSVLRDPALSALHGLALQVGALRARRRIGLLVGAALLLAILGAIIGIILAKDLLVKAAAARIPYSVEKKIGAAAFASYQATIELVDKPELQRVMASLAEPLARAAEDGRYEVRVFIQRSSEINAFALPGGTIVFTTELLKRASGYNEVSGVLAHELAHVTNRHAMRGIIESIGLFAIVQAAAGDVSGIAAVLASQGGRILSLKYSRDLEREADDKGFEYLVAAGQSAAGMASFFEKLLEEQEKRGAAGLENALNFLSTHPTTRDRIDRIRARLITAPRPRPAPAPALDFKNFQALLNP